jgi:ribosomal protein S18 acetylase RimI-like enzyme
MDRPPQPLCIVPAGDAHVAFVRGLSAEVFARFGDYETLLPRLMRRPSVATFVAEADGEPAGFAMLTLDARVGGAVELSAIAVRPGLQRRGIARSLLAHVEAEALARSPGSARLWLTLAVARDNVPARRLFDRAGYRVAPGGEDTYPAGQPSVAMHKILRGGP